MSCAPKYIAERSVWWEKGMKEGLMESVLNSNRTL